MLSTKKVTSRCTRHPNNLHQLPVTAHQNTMCSKKPKYKPVRIYRIPLIGKNLELSALTRGLSTFCIFHCFSITSGTTEKGHKTLYISSFKFCFRNFNVYNRFIHLHFIPAVGTTVVVFFRRRAEREV